MTTEDTDDRWSGFQETNKKFNKLVKKKEPPAPTLSDYLTRVLLRKSPRKTQERKYKVADQLVRLVTTVAYAVTPEYKTYINTDNKSSVKTTPLRTLSEDKYESMVPLVRPMRLDGFKIVQKGIDELPQHRCLIQVNPGLCKEEATLVKNDWEPYLNKEGCMRPKSILNWFNRGLHKACSVVMNENHNVDSLEYSVGKDGTASLNVTMTEFVDDQLVMDVFSVNVFPVFIVDQLPSSLKLNAPLPCFGPYIQGQKKFRELVLADIAEGKEVVLLDPKSEQTSSPLKNSLPGLSWKLNLSFTEYHVYSLIDKYCRGINFRHVLIFMNILRSEHPNKFAILNNEILVNSLFIVSQKHIHKLYQTYEWINELFQHLIDGLHIGFLASFYLPRQNMLTLYGIGADEQKETFEALAQVLKSIKEDPKTIYDYTGYEERRKAEDETENNVEVEESEEEEGGDTTDENYDNFAPLSEHADGCGKVISVKDEIPPSKHYYSPRDGANVEPSEVSTRISKYGVRSDIY